MTEKSCELRFSIPVQELEAYDFEFRLIRSGEIGGESLRLDFANEFEEPSNFIGRWTTFGDRGGDGKQVEFVIVMKSALIGEISLALIVTFALHDCEEMGFICRRPSSSPFETGRAGSG
jgi:hypothetical protein